MKRLLSLALCLVLLLTLTGCRKKEDPYKDYPNPIATITMQDGSLMRFELHLEIAPNTVANFTELANSGFYDGMAFHRVIPGVLIETGDNAGDGTGNAGYTIKGEFSDNGFENGLSHLSGVMSMARLENDPNSASSQFFIMEGNYVEYDGRYAAFGTALDTETLDTLRRIATCQVDGNYEPYQRQSIAMIRVNTHGLELLEVQKIEK